MERRMPKGILGFCNPTVDLIANVEESWLTKHNLVKGQGVVMKKEDVIRIGKELNFLIKECGGSGMNAIRVIGVLGYRVAVVGQYGGDENAQIVIKALEECRVENKCFVDESAATSCVYSCITPDKDRTMPGIFDASHKPYVEELDISIIDDYEAVMLEGYQFMGKNIDVVLEAFERAKAINKKTIFIISDMFQFPGYKEHLLRYMDNVSIITGNLAEFYALFDKNNLEDLLTFLENKPGLELTAVTMGEEGSYILHKGKRQFIPAPQVQELVDTTGAGDCFAGGLIFGYLSGYSLETSAKIANFLAGYTVERLGVIINRDVAKKVADLIAK